MITLSLDQIYFNAFSSNFLPQTEFCNERTLNSMWNHDERRGTIKLICRKGGPKCTDPNFEHGNHFIYTLSTLYFVKVLSNLLLIEWDKKGIIL